MSQMPDHVKFTWCACSRVNQLKHFASDLVFSPTISCFLENLRTKDNDQTEETKDGDFQNTVSNIVLLVVE
jgi:hypothetical protein